MGVLAKLLFFSLLIVVAPLGTFFSAAQGSWDAVLGVLVGQQALEANRLLLAGGLAVAAVNLVLVLFLVAAWQERPPPTNSKKED